nr:DUF1343 domain-containing protein [Alteromonas oceanisediminis]
MSLPAIAEPLTVGAERLTFYLPKIKAQRVGVVVNQSSIAKGQHLVDYLLAQQVNVTTIYAPEHGFRGDKGAGEKVHDAVDENTNLPVMSLYGKTRKPNAEMLNNVDVLIFDIQDVGVRFYTYVSTLHYVMEAAAEMNKAVIVLDRPNPNIHFVDGPVLDIEFQSFVGMHPVPVLHGMTLGEMALMIKGEAWIAHADALDLTVIPVADYTRSSEYELPIKPSPNLPNATAIQLYASLCFFEPTPFSIGRGTPFPFQVIGHSTLHLGDFAFTPTSMPDSAPSPKFQDQQVHGLDLRQAEFEGLDLSLLFEAYQQAKAENVEFFTSASFFDKLAGSSALREALQNGASFDDVKASWQADLLAFKQRRQPYLLY